MRKFISGLLLVLMSMSILAEDSAEIKKEVSGVNKNTTTEGRTILEGKEKDPTLQKVDLNLVKNKDQNIETQALEYNQEEPNDEMLAEISKNKTKSNYLLWGLGVLGVILVGVAAGSN